MMMVMLVKRSGDDDLLMMERKEGMMAGDDGRSGVGDGDGRKKRRGSMDRMVKLGKSLKNI